MGRDNQPKHRQARDLRRRKDWRAPYQRVLIVCEGEKTEPLYLGEIRQEHKLASANVQVWPSALGTEPLQVVAYAEQLLRHGDRAKGIEPLSFDRVFAVFDRDDHATYHAALAKADSLNGKIRNDVREPVVFQAAASVPCFEIWLLWHFEDVLAPIHRAEVYARLRVHLPAYEKGQGNHFAATKDRLDAANARAIAAALATTAHDGHQPYTDTHTLVSLLITLRNGPAT
jgi:hypothetical protein